MAETVIFVYGTLRRGERAHGLLSDARYVGPARTAPRYELRNLGPFPALIDGGRTAVHGELYAAARALLLRLDRYEGRDYKRTPVELEGGGTADAWLAGPEIAQTGASIDSGDWFGRRG